MEEVRSGCKMRHNSEGTKQRMERKVVVGGVEIGRRNLEESMR